MRQLRVRKADKFAKGYKVIWGEKHHNQEV